MTIRRYEASPVHADDDVCFTWLTWMPARQNFVVDYNITSEEVVVRMNLRSTVEKRVFRSRFLPSRFKHLYENCENLTEPYEVEFCASTETAVDGNDASATPSASILYVYSKPASGLYPIALHVVSKLISN